MSSLQGKPSKEEIEALLSRLQRDLWDVNKELKENGDDPSALGLTFMEEALPEETVSDDEDEEYYLSGPLKQENGQYYPFTRAALYRIFHENDTDRDNALDFSEFRRLLYRIGELEEFDSVCGNEADYKLSISEYDTDKSGNLTEKGFLQVCQATWTDRELAEIGLELGHEIRPRCASHKFQLLRSFRAQELDDSGRMFYEDFQAFAYEIGILFTHKQATEIATRLARQTRYREKKTLKDLGHEVTDSEEDTEPESDEGEETARERMKKAALRHTQVGFPEVWKWWLEFGREKWLQQKREMKHATKLTVHYFRFQAWSRYTRRRCLAALRMMYENSLGAVVSGVYNSFRPVASSDRKARFVLTSTIGPSTSQAAKAKEPTEAAESKAPEGSAEDLKKWLQEARNQTVGEDMTIVAMKAGRRPSQ